MADPQEVMDQAQPGQKVRYQLRGPATADELAEVEKVLEQQYPGVNFELSADATTSNAQIVED